jgi:hypothetical protein
LLSVQGALRLPVDLDIDNRNSWATRCRLWAEVRKETGRWKSRWRVRDLLADERCNRAVLDFLSTTDVGRLVLAPVEEDAQSEASEWELRERREREEERRAVAEGPGAEVEEPLFLPTPAFMASAEEE